MSLCSYSSDTHSGSFLVIENSFINEYLPMAPDYCVKVYLYGLYLCTNPNSLENTLQNICRILSMNAGEVKDAFEYWQAEGLVQLVETGVNNDLAIKYLPVQKRVGSSKKRQDKYSKFNSLLQGIVKGRMITPSEYNEYYTLIEAMHLEEEALLKITEYCVNLKGENVGYPYIITVANSFIKQGLTTAELVQDKLDEHKEITPELQDIMKTFGKKSAATLEDRNNYIKWINDYGFSHGTIKEVAKTIKGKSPSIALLDSILTSYYKLKLFSIKEIEEYNKSRDNYLALAKDITHTLGIRYDNLDTIIENYITDWITKGYDEDTLRTISKYCLKSSTKTVEGMNKTILRFYKLGLTTLQSINQYMQEIVSTDEQIQEILDKLNIVRNVNSWDRDTYRTWTHTWKISSDIIDLAVEFSKDKAQPIQYINKILSSVYEAKITTPEDAQKMFESSTQTTTKPKRTKLANERDFSQKDFDAMFDSLENIEISGD